jgi:hypothetical protein
LRVILNAIKLNVLAPNGPTTQLWHILGCGGSSRLDTALRYRGLGCLAGLWLVGCAGAGERGWELKLSSGFSSGLILFLVGETIEKPLRQRTRAESRVLKRKAFLVLLSITGSVVVVFEAETPASSTEGNFATNSDCH